MSLRQSELEALAKGIRRPDRLWNIDALLARPTDDWEAAGIYGWWFDQMPGACPHYGCETHEGFRLLYLGIGPASPSSTSSLQHRLLSNHVEGTARNSTLRLSLGSLLAERLGLRPVQYGGKTNFGAHEAVLTEWMKTHARVSVHPVGRPWEFESDLIRRLILPLNLEGNPTNSFAATLKQARSAARSAET